MIALILALLSTFPVGSLLASSIFSEPSPVIRVAVSLPVNMTIGLGQLRGVRIASLEAGGVVGGRRVEFVVMNSDDGTTWTKEKERENARRATDDPLVLAYMGPAHSDAAKISIPITSMAGLLQVAVTTSYPGLTKSNVAVGEPQKFYPSGKRNFFRHASTDDIQARSIAGLFHRLGIKRVEMVSDSGGYAASISRYLGMSLRQLGVLMNESITVSTSSLITLKTQEVLERSPDAVVISSTDVRLITSMYNELRSKKFTGIILPTEIAGLSPVERFGTSTLLDKKLYTSTPGRHILEYTDVPSLHFIKHYHGLYGVDPPVFAIDSYLLSRHILRCVSGGAASREQMLRCFHNLRENGEPIFDSRGDRIDGNASILKNVSGAWQIATKDGLQR